MITNVTAVIVSKKGGERLDQTLKALTQQTVLPSTTIAVTLGENTELSGSLAAGGISNIIAISARASYGEALDAATSADVNSGVAGHGWYWFLTEDSAPEENALEELSRAMERSGSAVVAGPKLVDWDDPRRIVELGQGLTWSGSRWVLDRQELDQEQYDHLEDVLGVGPVGLLVRKDVWAALQGFDKKLRIYDDALDFSIRARLSGYRVIVVPTARIRFAQTGVGGPELSHRHAIFRKNYSAARSSQLHRRLKYSKGLLTPLYWLALPVVGVIGMIWALIRGRPGTMLGEAKAALGAFFRPDQIISSRRVLKRNNSAGWGSIKRLRTDRKTVRSVSAIRKETILSSSGRQRQELHFISTGGLPLVATLLVLGVGLTWWLLGAGWVTGGSAGRLSNLPALWANTIGDYGLDLRNVWGYAEAVPSDPLNWVLATFGTLTFWNPSLAVVLLFILAVPLAGLGGWMWAARLTEEKVPRILFGVVWGLGPMLLSAMTQGRLNSVIVAAVLPWAFVAASNAYKTWSWASTSSLLAAIVLAAAPVLIPAATILWVIAMFVKPSKITKIALIGLAPLVLFLPLGLRAYFAGKPLDLFTDPGVQLPYDPGTVWQMMIGFPTFGMNGWSGIFESLSVGSGLQTLSVALLLVPIAALAVVGMFVGNPRFTVYTVVAGVLGIVTAVVGAQISLTSVGNEMVPLWAGSGLAVYWIAILSLAVLGLEKLKKAVLPVSVVAVICVGIVVAPSLFGLATNNVSLLPNHSDLPAVAAAKASTDPASKTVILTPIDDKSLRQQVVVGVANEIDEYRTVEMTSPISAIEENAAGAVVSLLKGDSEAASAGMSENQIYAIVLREPTSSQGALLHAQLQASFDEEDVLLPVGETSKGMLWRAAEEAPVLEPPARTREAILAWSLQLITLGGLLLLALPTAEVRYVPPKRRR